MKEFANCFRIHLPYRSLVKVENPVGSLRQSEIVGNDDKRIVIVAHQIPHEVMEHHRVTVVEVSGWLIGEKHLRRKPVAIDIKCGKGRIALIGFRPQHRAQTDGTYIIFFNCPLS